MNSETRHCQNCKRDFVIEPEDFEFYEKIKVPPPTWCPECRMVRRMNFKNERSFYKRECDLCSKPMLAIFPKDVSFPVYCPACWWSDKWDVKEYGLDYDFSKPFFAQFKELFCRVPRISLSIDYSRMINSDYANYAGPLKNCYLVIQAEGDEDCFYSSSLFGSKNSADCFKATDVQNSYELFYSEKCYDTFFSMNCFECVDVYFSKDLKNCSNCFGCANLRHKNYYIFNKPYSKEEYFKFIKSFDFGSFKEIQEYKEKIKQFWLQFPNKYYAGFFNSNVSGDYIMHSKNVFSSFEISGGEDLKYCFQAHMPTSKDCYDYSDWGNNVSLMYESVNCGENISNVKFSFGSWIGGDMQYCDTANSSDNMFGCSMIRKSKYCILNKQYTKEEYEALVPKIIEHMNTMPYTDAQGRTYKYGEFFPPELSPFAYNETIAQEYFPLTKESALEQGYRWKEPEEKEHTPTMSWRDLPDNIKDVSDSILNEAILCAAWDEDAKKAQEHNCTKVFRIIPQELAFYRKMSARGGSASGGNLPLPRFCPNSRHFHRIQQRNPLRLWHRKCMCQGAQTYAESDTDVSAQTHADDTQNNAEIGLRESASGQRESALPYINTANHFHGVAQCPNEFETSYAPERPEIVYCEQCYQSEVV